jgi:hypothetical protein
VWVEKVRLSVGGESAEGGGRMEDGGWRMARAGTKVNKVTSIHMMMLTCVGYTVVQ